MRIRRPDIERPFRVRGGLPIAWLVSIAATAWSLLATVCLVWPGLGLSEPDAALPAGFAGERLQFELLVLSPIVAVIALACVFHRLGRLADR